MEVAPVVIVLPLLWLSCKRFPLTTVRYVLIFLHAIVLMVGAGETARAR